ncbi:RNA polymerase sporulation sigma factor SigF [Ferroacidibacillus organovorans]|uniref:RNA polymerase sigma factor n=1 Tax=Ferroacidibacillus organovorans TaxID=1765683 RepID=A0A162T3X5_9BACL|nr:RNA polymerase sporulation sigma factor SigF [Ferroacidibacillus organovorans]KYP80438.1 RNA polymerase sigma-F factor [Ferroacidibacillus organovorans]OAG94665.1 RNA polymerase sigma-F factor [Ferroacidibacillus organovorans]OPG16621.1 RNA polymerase sigma-F factor [Ferroacidibacillus organovorans]
MEHGLAREFPKLSDERVRWLIEESHAGNEAARDELVVNNQRLVWSVVQRFLGRGYDPDDLFQIGCIGLLKAIDKFDLQYDVKFSTYAVPMIIGEIQRFLRDDSSLKVSRSVKETARHIRRVREDLMKQYGRQPQINEVAEAMGLTPAEVVLAQEAIRVPASIHETVFENDGDPIYLMDQIADMEQDKWFDRLALHDALTRLPERERLIVYMRFFRDKTQSEVADMLRISQVQVSRLEKRILQSIKDSLDEPF